MASSTPSLLVFLAALVAAVPARAQRTVTCGPVRVLAPGSSPTRVWRLGRARGPVPLTVVTKIGSGAGSVERIVTLHAIARPEQAGNWVLAGESVSVSDPDEAPFFRFESVTMKNTLDWRLVRVEGDRASLAVDGLSDVGPVTMQGKRMSVHGEIGGGAVVDATRPLPVEWTARGFIEMHLEPNPPDRVTMDVTLRTETEAAR
jgi:hypothetical protein